MKDLHIRSSQFELPQQYDTLKALCRCLRNGINREFFVIGATARDMLSVAMKVNTSKRTTKDLDICIAVESWDCFMEIQQKLMEVGFDKDPVRKQRFYYGDFELDVVPFGGLSDDGEKIYWPPEASPEMTVRGFESVLKECVKVVVDDGDIDFLIPTIAGLFITKLDAWIDRGLNKDNDIDDMMYLIDNFYLVNCTDDCYGEVFDAVEDADIFVSGAYMIAMDVARLLTDDEKRYYKAYLDGELAKQETSSLLQKSMDASGQEYKVVVRSWQMFSDRIMRS